MRRHRTLRLEQLELRQLLAVINIGYDEAYVGTGTLKAADIEAIASADFFRQPHTNPLNAMDTNHDLAISPVDVLGVVNLINGETRGQLLPLPPGHTPEVYGDVNADWTVSPVDALIIINYLNATNRPPAMFAAPVDDFVTFETSVISKSDITIEPTSQKHVQTRANTNLAIHGSYVGVLQAVTWSGETQLIAGEIGEESVGFSKMFSHTATTSLTIRGFGEINLTIDGSATLSTRKTFQCCGQGPEQTWTDDTASASLLITARGDFTINVLLEALRSDADYSVSGSSSAPYSEISSPMVTVKINADWADISGSINVETRDVFELDDTSGGREQVHKHAFSSLFVSGSGGGTAQLTAETEGYHLLGYADSDFIRDNHRQATAAVMTDGIKLAASATAEIAIDGPTNRAIRDWTGSDLDRSVSYFLPGYRGGSFDILDEILADREFWQDILSSISSD